MSGDTTTLQELQDAWNGGREAAIYDAATEIAADEPFQAICLEVAQRHPIMKNAPISKVQVDALNENRHPHIWGMRMLGYEITPFQWAYDLGYADGVLKNRLAA